jgi:hypothetical protein
VVGVTGAVGEALRRRFGPLVPMHDKPLSTMWGACGGEAVLKVYWRIAPAERRDREAQALALARGWGVPAPAVRESGSEEDYSWLLLDAVAITAPQGTDTLRAFVQRTLALTVVLQQRPEPACAGPGWLSPEGSGQSNSDALLDQLSARCAGQAWWDRLSGSLATLNDEPPVYLHGDIKPEHFLDDGHAVHVVDWEAAARGPAACDGVDAAFHLLRDLIYTDRPAWPLDSGRLPVTGPVAAWRFVRWLDRRRPDDLALVATTDLTGLIGAGDTPDVLRRLAQLITVAREAGVPR